MGQNGRLKFYSRRVISYLVSHAVPSTKSDAQTDKLKYYSLILSLWLSKTPFTNPIIHVFLVSLSHSLPLTDNLIYIILEVITV